MRKRKGALFNIGAILLCILLLAGCGSKSESYMSTAAEMAAGDTGYSYETDNLYMNSSVEYEEAEEDVEAPAMENGESSTPQVKDNSRKLIRTVNISAETEEFDKLMVTVTEKTNSFGGYVESSSIYNGSLYKEGQVRSATITLRIPQERLDEFLSVMAESSNVISKDESVRDVTLQYVDMKSHKEALETEQRRLLELLEKAESMEDIITVESRLSDVRYQIESMESQLRTMDNQVSYSTVYLNIKEVKKLTPVKEMGTWEKIATGFADSLVNVGRGIRDFFVWFIVHLPYLAVWAVVIFLMVMIIKALRKAGKKRKEKKAEKKLRKAQEKLRKAEESGKAQENGKVQENAQAPEKTQVQENAQAPENKPSENAEASKEEK